MNTFNRIFIAGLVVAVLMGTPASLSAAASGPAPRTNFAQRLFSSFTSSISNWTSRIICSYAPVSSASGYIRAEASTEPEDDSETESLTVSEDDSETESSTVVPSASSANVSQPAVAPSSTSASSTSNASTTTQTTQSWWQLHKPSYETTAGASIALGTVAAAGGALYGVHKLWQHRAKVAQWVKEHPYKATLFGLLGTLGIGGSAYAWSKWMPSSVNGFFSTGANTAWGKATGVFSHPAVNFIAEKAATPIIAGISLGLTNRALGSLFAGSPKIPNALSATTA